MSNRPRKSAEERFWSKVEKTDECWEWTAAKSNHGYGLIQIRSKDDTRWILTPAHRFSYEMAFGAIPEGVFVDHVCQQKSCVRPDHLRPVSNKQNQEHRSDTSPNNLSGYRGVAWQAHMQKWRASVRHEGVAYHCGYFDDKHEAAEAAQAKRLELFTHNDVDRAA